MNTPSHFIITAALRKYLGYPQASRAFLLGSVAPDIPLYLLSLGSILYYRVFLGWSSRDTFRHMFDYLYFHDPFWIALHNLLHTPTVLIIALAALVTMWRLRPATSHLGRGLAAFLLACLLHSAIDVLTHVDDGPLLFFPFNWHLRFRSPVSYWDSIHYGNQFAVFEVALNLVLLGYLLGPRLWHGVVTRYRRDRGFTAKPPSSES